MAKSAAKPPEHSFESALERLEHIVEEMEGDKLPLEELLGRYEEGIRLVKVCQERIQSAEKRIELISRNASGTNGVAEVELAPFVAAAEGGVQPAASPVATPAPARTSGRAQSKAAADDEVSLF